MQFGSFSVSKLQIVARGCLKRLVYDCCERFVISFNMDFPTIDEIMKCCCKQFLLDLCILIFSFS